MTLLDALNTEQRAAVEADDGPVVIIAGPGTGKTKTLTARIAYLVETGRAKPDEILALTFTNKAAREMQSRLALLMTSRLIRPTVLTFHGLAQRLLADQQRDQQLLGQNERDEVLRTVKKSHAVKRPIRDMSLLISRYKNQLQPPEDSAIASLLAAYNAELAQRNRFDFDDMLLQLYTFLLQADPKPKYRHILVDEFQDTNTLQYELLKQLNVTGNLFIIGDPLQSIYGFRGASASIFDRFLQDWPKHIHVTLTTNYRSSPEVVHAAAALFPNAPVLRPHRNEPGKVCVIDVLNEYSEADWVVEEIERQVGGSDMLRSSRHHGQDGHQTFKDFAVLYRTHAVARIVQRRLEASGIPYQVVGEGSPYEQPHIQTIISVIRYAAGEGDLPTIKGHSASQIKVLLEPLTTPGSAITELVRQTIALLGLDAEKHATSLRQFTNTLVPFDGQPLSAYLAHLQRITEQEYYDPAADAVTLLTIHAAKGLEFSRVFLIATEEGSIPHTSKSAETNVEEERRLFYVAMTRARDELYMLYARNRAGEQRQLSSFATELYDVVERITDPSLADQKRKLERRHQKRAQTSLF